MAEEIAILAGGCFWGMEELVRHQRGVLATRVGYCGGHTPNPTYEVVKTGQSGHAEALEVIFDPAELSYRALLEFFFQIHDPTTHNRQGNDVGTQYRSAIFATTPAQKETALALIAELNAARIWLNPIVTEVTDAPPFYVAESFHQNYLQRYPNGYTCHAVRPNWRLRKAG